MVAKNDPNHLIRTAVAEAASLRAAFAGIAGTIAVSDLPGNLYDLPTITKVLQTDRVPPDVR
jgi:hypothetical protein